MRALPAPSAVARRSRPYSGCQVAGRLAVARLVQRRGPLRRSPAALRVRARSALPYRPPRSSVGRPRTGSRPLRRRVGSAGPGVVAPATLFLDRAGRFGIGNVFVKSIEAAGRVSEGGLGRAIASDEGATGALVRPRGTSHERSHPCVCRATWKQTAMASLLPTSAGSGEERDPFIIPHGEYRAPTANPHPGIALLRCCQGLRRLCLRDVAAALILFGAFFSFLYDITRSAYLSDAEPAGRVAHATVMSTVISSPPRSKSLPSPAVAAAARVGTYSSVEAVEEVLSAVEPLDEVAREVHVMSVAELLNEVTQWDLAQGSGLASSGATATLHDGVLTAEFESNSAEVTLMAAGPGVGSSPADPDGALKSLALSVEVLTGEARAMQIVLRCGGAELRTERLLGLAPLANDAAGDRAGAVAEVSVPLPVAASTESCPDGVVDSFSLRNPVCDAWGHTIGDHDCDDSPTATPAPLKVAVSQIKASTAPAKEITCDPISLREGHGISCNVSPPCMMDALFDSLVLPASGKLSDLQVRFSCFLVPLLWEAAVPCFFAAPKHLHYICLRYIDHRVLHVCMPACLVRG